MEGYHKYEEFIISTKCSVENCQNHAEYEVVLYDYYPNLQETFYEQDFTCPFICQKHYKINERQAIGKREPRGFVEYPFTNKHGASGYSKYNPLRELYPQVFTSDEIENKPQIQIDLNNINSELISYLAQNPTFLKSLNSRKFEELIAELLRNHGYEVTLTPKTRDGGKDIIGLYKSPFGHQMFIVECKKYHESNKVSVELVRGLYGVQKQGNYNQAILATTSTFTKDAIEFVKPLKLELALKDYTDIITWCQIYSKGK